MNALADQQWILRHCEVGTAGDETARYRERRRVPPLRAVRLERPPIVGAPVTDASEMLRRSSGSELSWDASRYAIVRCSLRLSLQRANSSVSLRSNFRG